MTSDVSVAWITWAGSFLLLALISLASYALIERPRLRRRTAQQNRSAVRCRRQIEPMDLLVAAAPPVGDEVLIAAIGRVADLHGVDSEHAGRLGIIAAASQRRRSIADLHQIGLAGRWNEVLAGHSVGRFHDMDHTGVRILRGQPVVENLHSGKKRYRHDRKAPDYREQNPTDRRPHGQFFTFYVAAMDVARTILHVRLVNCQGLVKTPRDPPRSPIEGL
jgi:hypothetical protein